VAPLSFHTQVYLNGQFYGLFGMIEEVRQLLTERGCIQQLPGIHCFIRLLARYAIFGHRQPICH
jgi:hypothetical protein